MTGGLVSVCCIKHHQTMEELRNTQADSSLVELSSLGFYGLELGFS